MDSLFVGQSLRRKTAVGIAWMSGSRAAIRLLGLLSTLILARLLTPADFGLVAMATAVAAALELLTQFSFHTALIQKRELARDDYDSVWTLQLLLGGALALGLLLLATPSASFYREPRVAPVMTFLALKYLLDSATNPGTVDFQRNLAFAREFILQVVPKVVSVIVTLLLAFLMRDYRALLGGMLIGSVASLLLGYLIHPHRPRPCLTQARALFHFSKWLLLNNLVNFLRTRTSEIVIGRTLGQGPLGLFSVSSEVANLPSSEMVAPINRVLFPSYVLLADQPDRLRAAFRATLGAIALLILPASVGLAAVADPLLRVMLGTQWLEAIPLVKLLAIAGATSVLQTNTGAFYNAIGRPKLIALTGSLHAATLIPAIIYATSSFGLIGTAWAIVVHSVFVGMPLTYYLFVRNTPIELADLLEVTWRPLLASAVMFLAVDLVVDALLETSVFLGSIGRLIIAVACGIVVYVACGALLWRFAGRPDGAEQLILERARAIARRLLGSA